MRILVAYLWDTRPGLARFWQQAPRIIKHNVATMLRDKPEGMDIDIVVHLHLVSDMQAPMQLIRDLRIVRLRTTRAKVSDAGRDHLVVMNWALQSMFGSVSMHGYDRVFVTEQDWLLVNHYDANFFEVLEDALTRNGHPRNAELGLYRDRDSYDFIACTKPPGTDWRRFGHNPAFYFSTDQQDVYKKAYNQMVRSYECELGHSMGIPGLWLAPNDYFCIRSPHYHWTKEGVNRLLAFAADPSLTQRLHEVWRDPTF